MFKLNERIRRCRTPYRWALLLAPLGLCGWWLAVTALSQGQDRAVWDKQFEEARANARGQTAKPKPAPSPVKPGAPTATVAGDELLGLTFWRLRPATSDNTGEPRLSVEQRGQGVKAYRLERADIETPFREGEMVRFSVETTRTDNRYLYVINREVYADKTTGEPYLIFPTRATPPGGNVIAAGKLVYVPAQGDAVPYFTLQRKRPDHVGEMLTIILSPEPLPLAELPESGAPLKLDAALVKQWEQQWGGPTERREARGGAGKEWTKTEQAAERGQTALKQGDPLPQMIYRLKSKAGGRVLLTVPLKLANYQNTAERSEPELVVQMGHSSEVRVAVYSPDGRLILTGSEDGTARLWDVTTGAELRRFAGHSRSVESVAYSPDGKFVLTGSEDGTARIWNAATGIEVRSINVNSGSVIFVTFSPDGLLLLTGVDKKDVGREVYLWDVTTGAKLRSFVRKQIGSLVAFSPDGKSVLIASNNEVCLWDLRTGNQRGCFNSHAETVTAIALSRDGSVVLTGSYVLRGGNVDNTVRLWNMKYGTEIRKFKRSLAGEVAFSPDGRFVLSSGGGENTVAHLWDIATGDEIRRFERSEIEPGHYGGLMSVAYSSDGRSVLTVIGSEPGGNGMVGGAPGRAMLWDVATGKKLREFRGEAVEVNSVAFSPDGHSVMTGSREGMSWLWELGTRTVIPLRHGPCTAYSADGRYLLTGGFGGVRLWDATTGNEVRRFGKHSDAIVRIEHDTIRLVHTGTIAISPDGRFLLDGCATDWTALWDTTTGKMLRLFKSKHPVPSVAFSPTGSSVLIGNELTKLPNQLEQTLAEKEDPSYSHGGGYFGSFTPDGRFMLVEDYNKGAVLINAVTGEEVRSFPGVGPFSFSPDNRFILNCTKIASGDLPRFSGPTVQLWDRASGAKVRDFVGHIGSVMSLAMSPDGRFLLSGSRDGTARLWDVATGKELCKLVTFLDGTWAVIDNEGRFDTNNLERVRGLYWMVPDSPFTSLPIEIFMREYYEPALLSRILASEQFKPIKLISDLNRVQPKIGIGKIEPQSNTRDVVSITVEVAGSTGTVTRGGKQVTLESSVYDLRLFRDGQLVGYAPEQDGPIKLESGKATITFKDIKLPRRADLKQVEFSAYAFNVDRVKSETARQTYVLPRPLPAVKGRAYVIAVGVNAYENAALDLNYAANDARRLQGVLTEKLKAAGEYEEVVPLTLLSDYEWKDGRRAITAEQATKGNVKLALDLLAGRPVDAARLAGVANADKLRQARPEDLVILSFASHGYADEAGRFYFVTYDTGADGGRAITPALLQKSISSDELSRWLRDVDAGELVMIVDACQSAAAVEGEGFKPGPMGSRGLGQLAYDKGMRILAATQADNAALEHTLIRQGLLSYALTRDGIELGRADFKPEDKTITLGEWLEYARDRVPQLFAEVRSGQVRSSGAADAPKVVLLPQKNAPPNQTGAPRLFLQGKAVGATGKLMLAEEQIQQPALFDYARKRRDVILLRK